MEIPSTTINLIGNVTASKSLIRISSISLANWSCLLINCQQIVCLRSYIYELLSDAFWMIVERTKNTRTIKQQYTSRFNVRAH
eukprot:scaffold3730_cov101-Cylindrotheca_fusiformis.AAC.1